MAETELGQKLEISSDLHLGFKKPITQAITIVPGFVLAGRFIQIPGVCVCVFQLLRQILFPSAHICAFPIELSSFQSLLYIFLPHYGCLFILLIVSFAI